jgi:fluoroacetyl-CoA thioesterase
MGLEPGLSAKVSAVVTEEMTAVSQGSGEVNGLATPVMTRLMEAAAVKAVGAGITPDVTTVGSRLEIVHMAPTPVGMKIEAHATLLEVEGRLLVFAVSAEDEAGVIGRGTHERVVVTRQGFADKIGARWAQAEVRSTQQAGKSDKNANPSADSCRS